MLALAWPGAFVLALDLAALLHSGKHELPVCHNASVHLKLGMDRLVPASTKIWVMELPYLTLALPDARLLV